RRHTRSKRDWSSDVCSSDLIVSGAMGSVLSAISTGMQGALNVVTGVASSFLDAGKNIVKSIADGIMGAMSLVTDAISNVTQAVQIGRASCRERGEMSGRGVW